MQPNNQQQNNSIGSLMRQNMDILPQGGPKSPTKKAYKYPYFDSEAINQTIQNAKRFAEEFNKAQEEKSKGINKINRELRIALKDMPHTAEQKVAFLQFKQENKLASLEPMAYNQKVLEFNRKHGSHFLLRTHRTLKNEIAVTFAFLVNFYAAQIRDNNARKMNAGVTTAGTLPRMLTNSESIKRYKIKGVQQCPYQNDAILSHVHNLVDAGILINYKSHGRNMGFSVEFNPEILEVKDHNFTKLQKTENETIIKFKTGKPTYSDCITRTGEDKNEIKGDADGLPRERNVRLGRTTAATGSTYRVTKSEENPGGKANFQPGSSDKNRPAESEKPEQEKPGRDLTGSAQAQDVDHPSKKLENRIRDTWQLCQELAQNQHVHHIPPMKELAFEASKGVLSQPVFRVLIFQEFMKVISRLKRENQSAAGAFYRAFEELEDMKLKNFAGRYFDKKTMFQEFEKWLWMINHAENWAKKKNFQLLYINDYLDTQRRDAKEVGFWYLEKQWKQNEKKKETRKKKRQQKVQDHNTRKKKIKLERVEKYGYRSVKPGTSSKSLSDYEKARQKVRKYLYGQIEFEELHRYCRHNLSQTIVDGLRNLIDAEAENIKKFNA
ncbi:hypothetical protein E0K83_03790 [Gramella sp. BOM4]|nr:hypothetical protein [Christiangramia bathymodioli]